MKARCSEPGGWARHLIRVAMIAALAAWSLAWQAPSSAHEVRPSYLEVREDRPGEFDVLFKTPMRGQLRLALTTTFSGRSEDLTPMTTRADRRSCLA